MTKQLYLDCDGLSAFLWAEEERLLPLLYPNELIIPSAVYTELSRPCISHLRQRLDALRATNPIPIQQILVGTDEHKLFLEMTRSPKKGFKIIDNGEAAAIALAKKNNGVLVSNNLSDVKQYVDEFGIQLLTTGDILMAAECSGLVTENEANIIWQKMLNKQRRIGARSYIDYKNRTK